MCQDLSLKESIHLWGIDRAGPYRSMLLDFIEGEATRLAESLSKPHTGVAWLRRAPVLRARLLHSMGLSRLPERTPLSPRLVGKIERSAYTIEKLIYEVRPGFPVPAHLYVPSTLSNQAPAVLYALGHGMLNAKLGLEVQMSCANLALQGFVVLVFDPIGQGERLGDWLDHGHLEPLLVGYSQAGLMVWESMRAIDYLVSRQEVDANRIGMTGASGGGLNTLYTAAVDSRVQVSVPVCYITTFLMMMTAERDRNWEDGADLCNQVPTVMAYSDMSDILGLFAPKPLCIVAGVEDPIFPIEGVRLVYRDTTRLYGLLGAADRIRLVEVDAGHGYDRTMREAAYGWFARWLQGEEDGKPIREQEFDAVPEPYQGQWSPVPASIECDSSGTRSSPGWCFPAGTAPEPGPAITALVRDTAEALTPRVSTPTSVAQWTLCKHDLAKQVQLMLGRFPERTPLNARVFNQTLYKGLFADRIVLESEPGIEMPSMFLAPAEWKAYLPIVVYVDEWGKEAGLANGMIEALLSAQFAVFAIDVRGVGETAASDFEASTDALMGDRPLFGQRVWDVLRAVDWLRERTWNSIQLDKERIGCVGRGVAGLLALYAAALDERLVATATWEAPVSYRSLIVERPGFPPSTYLFDVLNHFDLPLLMAAVAPRSLLLAEPVDGERQLVLEDSLTEALEWPRNVYSLYGAGAARFRVLAGLERQRVVETIARWLQEQM